MSDPLDDLVDSASRVLDLPIAPEWKAAVKMNLQVNLRHGAHVAEFRLADDTEPAPVFVA